VAAEQKAALKKAAGVSGGKDECQVRLKGREHDSWMGTEISMLGGYGSQGQVTAGDGSDKQGKMGAGYNNLRRKKKKQQCKVGREEEGSSSNWPELAAFLLVLRDTLIVEPLLYLCDNQSLLIGGLVKVERQCWWGHLTRIFWQQLSRYYERGLQQGQQPSWSKCKCIEQNQRMREVTFWRIRLHIEFPAKLLDYFLRSNKSNINQYFRSEGRQRLVPTDELGSLHVEKTVPRGRESNLSRSSFEEGQQRIRCKNMKRSLQVLGDK